VFTHDGHAANTALHHTILQALFGFPEVDDWYTFYVCPLLLCRTFAQAAFESF
jgi:hypothetical protein